MVIPSVTSPTGGVPPTYEYSLDGVNFQASPNFGNLPAGTYVARIRTSGSGCVQTYTRAIVGSTELTATITPGTTICVGETATKRSIQFLTEHHDGMLVLICR